MHTNAIKNLIENLDLSNEELTSKLEKDLSELSRKDIIDVQGLMTRIGHVMYDYEITNSYNPRKEI